MNDLIAEAMRGNPEILAARQRYEGARQKPSQEASLPNPVVSYGYSSVGNPWPVAGLGVWQVSHLGFTISQELPFPGKRRLRGEMALREADAEFQRYWMARLRVLAEVKRAYRRLQYTWSVIDVVHRNKELLRKFLEVTQEPFVTIRGAQEAELALLETRILRLKQEKRIHEVEINRLLDRDPEAPLGPPEELDVPALPDSLEELLAKARANAPALRLEQKEIERAEIALDLAQKDYYPDYRISAGYLHMGAMPSLYEFRVDFSLPVYFWRKQKRAAAERLNNLTETRHSYQATDRSLEAEITREYLNAETSSRLARMYTERILPQLNLAVESSLAAYRAGSLDIMPFLSNIVALVDAEVSRSEEALAWHLALIRIDELTAEGSDR